MSTNISGAALDFLRNKFGATIDRQEARELGIKKDEDFETYDIDASDDLDIDDEVVTNEDLSKLVNKWYDEQQELLAEAGDEEEGIKAPQGASGGGQA